MEEYFDNIFALADIHGKWQPLRDFYLANKLKYKLENKKNVMILLGDSGLNYFFNYRDDDTKEKLCSLPFTYFIIRGNHEERPSIRMANNPDNWYTEDFWGGTVYVESKYPQIKYADDEPCLYSLPYIAGYYDGFDEDGAKTPYFRFRKVLTLPGAYSVDKQYRLINSWSWFEGEQMTPAEMDKAREIIAEHKNIDLVLSHTCPIIYEPTDLFLPSVDQSMVDKTMERFLGEVEYNIDYKLWLWGHYHALRIYPTANEGKSQPIMLFNGIALDVADFFANYIDKVDFDIKLAET